MQIDDIRLLAEIMKEQELTSLEWSHEGESLKLTRTQPGCGGTASAPQATVQAVAAAASASVTLPAAREEEGFFVEAPMVGVLYLAPSPESAPFVKVGDSVKQGDVLCIIEAMKLMNEITAEQDGVVTGIEAANGQIVEFGQPLFRLK